MSQQKYNTRELTNRLRELAAEVHDSRLNDEGEMEFQTKGEALSEAVFRSALGWIEEVVEETDVPGKTVTKKVFHKPQAWAQQFIWDRLEGKSPQALPDDKGGLSAADKVSELAKQRVNALTEETDGESERDNLPDRE
jgi:hypothetical protein